MNIWPLSCLAAGIAIVQPASWFLLWFFFSSTHLHLRGICSQIKSVQIFIWGCWQGTFQCNLLSRTQEKEVLVMAGHSVPIRNLEWTFQLEAESVFPSPSLTESKMCLKLQPTTSQTLITRQSYWQKMKHCIIKPPSLAINLTVKG